jgi:hypothetical protein
LAPGRWPVAEPESLVAEPELLVAEPELLVAEPELLVAEPELLGSVPRQPAAVPIRQVPGERNLGVGVVMLRAALPVAVRDAVRLSWG